METAKNTGNTSRPSIRRDQLLTVQDLFEFKTQLLTEFKAILGEHQVQGERQWLKAFEIRKMLRLSPGKLQYMRDKGVIPFKKLGGITYYDLHQIEQLMQTEPFANHKMA
jgi:hypothetical protein